MKFALVLALLLCTSPALAAVEQPDFSPKPGQQITLGTMLTDETGQQKTLSDFLHKRPAVVVFGYHDCPNLCGVEQQLVAKDLGGTGLAPDGYEPLFITLAPEEGPSDAKGAKQRLADAVGKASAAPWHFLSGPDVAGLGEEFGITAIERERIKQYVHPVAIFTLTPDGRISHVLPGLDVTPNDMRLALVEASAGKLGTLIDKIVLFCAGYDATTGRYSSLIMSMLRIVSVVGLALALGALVLLGRGRKWGT
ncbi:SCO family protein [Paradevosia shaoguanensis]|uniref:SCO family protein n=1 Tax=Paradevosia shaoguanensis TaxID=1335043 RepID=UPI00193371CD|nr:SCO family protein [Paradevosia shaoguanensis]